MQTSAEKIREDGSHCFGSVAKEEPAFCLGETIAIHGQMDRLLKANGQMNAQNSAEDPQIGQKGSKRHAQLLGRIRGSHQIKIQNHLRLQVKGSKTYLGELL